MAESAVTPTSITRARPLSVERVCYLVAEVLCASGLFHLVVFALAGGPWDGPISWRKPSTFGLSFGLTLAAVTWLAALLPLADRTRRVLLLAFAADSCIEVAGITLQAWRRVPSHVDMQGSFNTAVSMCLAAGGAVLLLVLGCMATAAFRGDSSQPPSMRLALRAGFATLIVGLLSGAAMIARGVALVKTGHQFEAYHAVGFLKSVHFVSLHGVIVLPAVAWLAARLSWPEPKRIRTVMFAVGCYAAAILGTLILSLATM